VVRGDAPVVRGGAPIRRSGDTHMGGAIDAPTRTAYRYGGYGYETNYWRYRCPGYYAPYYSDCWRWYPNCGWATWWTPWCGYWWRWWWGSSWLNCYGSYWYYPWSDPYPYGYYVYNAAPIVERETVVVADSTPAVDLAPDPGKDTPEGLARYFTELGDLYFKTRRYARAAEAYTRAVRLMPKDGSLRLAQSDAWFAMGDYDKAAYALRQGFFLDPRLAESDYDKTALYGKASDFAEHLDQIAKHLEERSFDAQARLVLAYNFRFSGQREKAREQLTRLRDELPGDAIVELLLTGIDKKPEDKKPEAPPPAAEPETKKV
jgi:tetratricopeptide (TPR) repeat protein